MSVAFDGFKVGVDVAVEPDAGARLLFEPSIFVGGIWTFALFKRSLTLGHDAAGGHRVRVSLFDDFREMRVDAWLPLHGWVPVTAMEVSADGKDAWARATWEPKVLVALARAWSILNVKGE